MTQKKEHFMKTMQFLKLVTIVALFAGCAAATPHELIDARSAYKQASEGPAKQLAPAELHKAQKALALAEQSFQEDPKSYKTRDLAYVAQRKSQLAGVMGAWAADKGAKSEADAAFLKKQTEIVKQGKQDLIDSKKQADDVLDAMAADKASKELSDSKKETADVLAAKKTAADKASKELSDSKKETADALVALANLAAVKEEERGLVITLSGSVLFKSNESTLLPSAQVKLDQVVKALLAVGERYITVEGHTDSKGSDSSNIKLSKARADAVRSYLIQKGYPADLMTAIGVGEGQPIADNTSAEGRANNRRVEIIIKPNHQ
jgi:outer membrane protein OmpA-like peptidoglycan-associated protein